MCPVTYFLCWVCTCMWVVILTKATMYKHIPLGGLCNCLFTLIMFLFIYFITSLELRRKSLIFTNIHVLPYTVYDLLAVWGESFLNDMTFFSSLITKQRTIWSHALFRQKKNEYPLSKYQCTIRLWSFGIWYHTFW